MTSAVLPYPPSILSPNKRTHWAPKAKAFKKYKTDCSYLLREHYEDFLGKTDIHITFCPPDNRRRDMDNALASFKAGIDALSYITGMDDSRFTFTLAWGEPVKHGAVMVCASGVVRQEARAA